MNTIRWQWYRLHELTHAQVYALFAVREAVFVVEQHCAYQELDGLDLDALHLIGWQGDQVVACLRVLAPGVKYAEAALGRIMTAPAFRANGLGRELMQQATRYIDAEHQGRARISAQAHLENFYRDFGFVPVSSPYLEDGIPHIEMLRQPA